MLALNGENDLQVPGAENLREIEATLKAAGNKDVTVMRLPKLNHMFQTSAKFSTNGVNHRGWAWMSLCLALAAHVFDEAMTDYLSVYNLQEGNRETAFRDTDCVNLGGLTLESARASR